MRLSHRPGRYSFLIFRTAIVVLVSLLAASHSAADQWPSATPKAVVSENAQIVVRITPGTSVGDTYGFSGASKGKFASAQWFRYRDNRYELYLTTHLLNPVAPIDVAVTNDGTVVTLDNWHNVGFGEIVAIYAPDGKLRKKYALRDLFSSTTIEKIERSVSSIWWRCVGAALVIDRRNTLEVDDTLGGRFTFDLTSGDYKYAAVGGQCKRR